MAPDCPDCGAGSVDREHFHETQFYCESCYALFESCPECGTYDVDMDSVPVHDGADRHGNVYYDYKNECNVCGHRWW